MSTTAKAACIRYHRFHAILGFITRKQLGGGDASTQLYTTVGAPVEAAAAAAEAAAHAAAEAAAAAAADLTLQSRCCVQS